MHNRNQDARISSVPLACCAQYEHEEGSEQVVVFELIVPRAAKVALPRLQPEVSSLTLRKNSITSTVPGKLYLELRASNTALGAGWCMTATLAASASAARPRR